MSALDLNPPAFPVELGYKLEPGEPHQTGNDLAQFPGMSLRDWFAGQALIGFLTVNAPSKLDDPSPALAWASYHMADAMLAERAKAGQP